MQKKSLIKERILEYADTLNISRRKFYETIGISRGTLEAKSGITEDILEKFLSAYPQISIEWLLLGNGDMLTNDIGAGQIYSSTIVEANVKGNSNAFHPIINTENAKVYQDIIKQQSDLIHKLIDLMGAVNGK